VSQDAAGFGARLRACRDAAGLSQEDLAARSGVSLRAIGKLEQERTRWPYRETVQRLADALELRGQARAAFVAAAGRRRGRVASSAAAVEPAPPGTALGADLSSAIVPRQLPGAAAHFTGRAAELKTLDAMLERADGQWQGMVVISAIGGTAGVGKTALAVHWAYQVAAEFPDGQLFVNLRGFDPTGTPVTPADAVRVLLEALHVPADRLPATVEAQLGLYRSLLAGQRVLIVLDNAFDEAQVRPLLPGSPTCRVVVTSRNQLTGLAAIEAACPLTLDVLTEAEALQLLHQRLGAERVSIDPGATARIIKSCARLPLALSIIAARAAMRPDLPLAQIAADLAARPGLEAFTAGPDPAADVRAALSWSCRQLDADTARAFRLAGLHPGPDFDPHAIAALTGTRPEQAGYTLGMLTRGSLIQPAGPGRHSMHDLLCSYARELTAAQDSEEEQRAALTRLFDYYLYTASVAMDILYPAECDRRPRIPPPLTPAPVFADEPAAQAWLDAERPSLVAIAAEHGWPAHAIRLSITLFRYLDVGGHFPEAISIHTHCRRAARHVGDRAAEGRALSQLGAVDLRQRRHQQAVGHYEQSLAIYREVDDQPGQGNTLGNLGFAEFLQGHCEQAVDHFTQSLAIQREVGNRSGEAHTLASLGFAELRQGRYQSAADHLHLSLDLFRDTSDRVGVVHALGQLSEVDLREGRYQQAADQLQQALNLCREIGDRSSEGALLAIQGMLDLRQGRHRQASDHLQQVLSLCRETGDLWDQATALNSLGEVLLAMGRLAEASEHCAGALDAAAEIGEKYEQARAHDGLARICQASGEAGKARGHWQEALALFTELGAPEADAVRALLTTDTPNSARTSS
jgi:tetratricopeptide (TPR) repeat protein/transcriptional regulator with XRE-family HTH domain